MHCHSSLPQLSTPSAPSRQKKQKGSFDEDRPSFASRAANTRSMTRKHVGRAHAAVTPVPLRMPRTAAGARDASPSDKGGIRMLRATPSPSPPAGLTIMALLQEQCTRGSISVSGRASCAAPTTAPSGVNDVPYIAFLASRGRHATRTPGRVRQHRGGRRASSLPPRLAPPTMPEPSARVHTCLTVVCFACCVFLPLAIAISVLFARETRDRAL